MIYVDSHCHLNDEAFINNLDEIVNESKGNGVNAIVVVGYDLLSSIKATEIASKYDGVFATVGFHPENLDGINDGKLDEIKNLARNEKVIGIGEIGLDYHWYKEDKDHFIQKQWFIKQLKLADSLDLPVSIHAREATKDTLDILKEYAPKRKGVLHCYSGSIETMKELEKLGFYFGFDGPITYKNSITPKECVKAVDIDRILSETDSPYLTPVPFRGKANSPSYVRYIVCQMAILKEVPLDFMQEKIKDNFERLFHVKL
ncbi:MAG TPA: hydrolase TatD [Firmicutes bacterium]|nr:hydrolase TatD [Bacillota bacterium]